MEVIGWPDIGEGRTPGTDRAVGAVTGLETGVVLDAVPEVDVIPGEDSVSGALEEEIGAPLVGRIEMFFFRNDMISSKDYVCVKFDETWERKTNV